MAILFILYYCYPYLLIRASCDSDWHGEGAGYGVDLVKSAIITCLRWPSFSFFTTAILTCWLVLLATVIGTARGRATVSTRSRARSSLASDGHPFNSLLLLSLAVGSCFSERFQCEESGGERCARLAPLNRLFCAADSYPPRVCASPSFAINFECVCSPPLLGNLILATTSLEHYVE